jgi:plastocyanin
MSSAPIVDRIRIIPRPDDFLDRNVGASGEVFFNRATNSLRVYSGRDRGGFEIAKTDLSNISNSVFAAKATAAGVGGGSSGSGASISVSATVPLTPDNGNLWLNTNSGYLYVYVNDGSSSQWIQPAIPTPSIPSLSAVAVSGSYNDLLDKPVLSGDGQFSGSYNDLTDKPGPLTEIGFAQGVIINQFSIDDAMTDDSDAAVPVESAVRGYIDRRLGIDHDGIVVSEESKIGPGFAALTGASFTGPVSFTGLTTLQQSAEVFNTISGAQGVVTHDFSTGAIWYHTTIAANFTANFTNVPTTSNRTIVVALILNQGSTGRLPTAIQINGASATITWPGDVQPTPNTNQIDIVSFTLLRIGSTWNVLGSLSGGDGSAVQNLQDLSNVTISSVSDGQVLKYNASSAQWVNAADLTGAGGSGISLSDLSVTVAAASGNGTLSYNNTTGIFTFTPPSLGSFITLSSISATGDISYNNSTGVISFNNSTGYITRTGISVTQAAASGNGSLVYSNSTGVLTYTPPDLSSVSGGTASNSFATIAVSGQSNVVADSTTDTLTLVAGSGISITTDASTDAITITNTGGAGEANQNAFSNIAVAGQSTVAADSATDTVTLVAGSGISITTDAGTDTVTITSTVSSGATAFTGLSDSAGLTVDRIYLPAITMLSTTNNGASSYRFDQYGATDNPTVYAINGTTIAFNLNVAGHPFLIQTAGGANYNEGLTHVTTAGVVTTGSNAQGKTSGTLYWKIPFAISGNYRYICSVHGAMVGTITIKDFSAI